MRDGVRNDSAERLELEKSFEELPEYKWLQDNAYKYGFEQSYREDNIQDTYYHVESWHWKLIIK
jgi:LAS superfamily LD-carboxypeptidase LdcB